jgi:AraC family transcriptional activator FtrA
MRTAIRTPSVVCLVYEGLSLFEAGVAAEVFAQPRPEVGRELYRFAMAQTERGELRSQAGLRVRADGGLELLRDADLVVVPGWRDHREPPAKAVVDALRQARAQGSRLLSICSGAFVLAATGLLDGRAATTHWRYAEAFRARFPLVELRPDVLYVDVGDVVTSAGSSAGIDACLHIVRQDHGFEVANLVARTMVTAAHRSGGQAQFIPAPVAMRPVGLVAPVLDWARERLQTPLKVSEMAAKAAMSERSFLRHFHEQVGVSPVQWLRRERVALAQQLLESGGSRLEAVAASVGFGSASTLRSAFKDLLGAPPSQHRKQFAPRKPSEGAAKHTRG